MLQDDRVDDLRGVRVGVVDVDVHRGRVEVVIVEDRADARALVGPGRVLDLVLVVDLARPSPIRIARAISSSSMRRISPFSQATTSKSVMSTMSSRSSFCFL